MGDRLLDLMPIGDEIPFDPGQIEKALVDGIDFLPGTELAQRCHEAIAHVGVQLVVGGERYRAYLFCPLFHFKPGVEIINRLWARVEIKLKVRPSARTGRAASA